ncbi:MAG: hypothetical protein QME74_05430 [Candidatus Edwardsbacteria bacterium]|nr:hypothetical protein [Candidatus Edwardsbacteria bacterium]
MKSNYTIHYQTINEMFKLFKIDFHISPLAGCKDYDKQMRNLYDRYKQQLIKIDPKTEKIIKEAKIAPEMGLIYLLKHMNENPDSLKYDFGSFC